MNNEGIEVALSLSLVAACSSPQNEAVSSTTVPLTTSSFTWYPNSAPLNYQPGNVTTQVISTPGSICSPDAKNVTSAWEIRDPVGAGYGYNIDWAISCSTTGGVAQPPQTLTTLNGGDTPPEWLNDPQSDGSPMIWVGQPHLVTLGPPGWIALVGLVGDGAFNDHSNDTTQTAVNIGVVLSTNGGQTWEPNSAHLAAPTDGQKYGGTNHNPESVRVTDLAVAAATWNNAVGTHDIFVVWTTDYGSGGSTFVNTVSYAYPGKNWNGGSATPTQLQYTAHEPAAVAGTHPVIGNFLYVMNPVAATTVLAGQCPGSEQAISQTWHSQWSAQSQSDPVGVHWFVGRVPIATLMGPAIARPMGPGEEVERPPS